MQKMPWTPWAFAQYITQEGDPILDLLSLTVNANQSSTNKESGMSVMLD